MQAILYSGTGNLLWVLEVPFNTSIFADPKWARLAVTLCRDQGDGVMFVTSQVPYSASFMNPDGSDGVFCGNGVRCVAYHLAQKYQALTSEILMAGQRIAYWVSGDSVRIELPKLGVQNLGLDTLELSPGVELTGCRMNMPNPHWVVLSEITDAELEHVGKRAAELYNVHGGMNVEFVFKNKEGLWQARVYERGAGITKACGSGAMAVLCVLQNEGLVMPGQVLDLTMSGGVLRLQDLGSHLSLQGQVQLVTEKVIHAF